jgi:hypothetical protein
LTDVKRLLLELHAAAGFTGDPFAVGADSHTVIYVPPKPEHMRATDETPLVEIQTKRS